MIKDKLEIDNETMYKGTKVKQYLLSQRKEDFEMFEKIINSMSFSSDKQENIDAHNEIIEKLKEKP